MKTITRILMIAGIMLVSMNMAGQTTQTEYSYITTAYGTDMASGRDIKAGYTTKGLGAWNLNNGGAKRNIEYLGFMKQGKAKQQAFIMKLTRAGEKPVYFCIPSADAPEDLWKQAAEKLKSVFNDGDTLRAITMSLMRLSAQEAAR